MPGESGYVSEIFLSIQGEGLHVGRLQLFVRTAGCSQRCDYCDTDYAWERTQRCTLVDSGQSLDNPVDSAEIARVIEGILERAAPLHAISITGGEPLEQPDFVISLLERTRPLGVRHYLETNGLHPEALRRLLPLVDIISFDIKLPSLCGGGDLFAIYERSLGSLRREGLFFKIVVSKGFDREEFLRAVRLIAESPHRAPLVIQPATEDQSRCAIDRDTLIEIYAQASRELQDVRIIPQCHRLLDVK